MGLVGAPTWVVEVVWLVVGRHWVVRSIHAVPEEDECIGKVKVAEAFRAIKGGAILIFPAAVLDVGYEVLTARVDEYLALIDG